MNQPALAGRDRHEADGPEPPVEPVAGPSVGARLAGAAAGIACAGLALGVGEFVAAFVRPQAAPALLIGNRVVQVTPGSIKRWAIETFAHGDKPFLFTAVFVVVALLSALVGALAVGRRWIGPVGFAGAGAVELWAALTVTGHHGSDWLPGLFGAAVGAAGALVADRRPDRAGAPNPPAGQRPRARSRPTGVLRPDRRRGRRRCALGLGRTGHPARALCRGRGPGQAALPAPTSAAPSLPAGVDLGVSAVPFVTRNDDFYLVNTELQAPQIDPKDWRLRIHGMVHRPMTVTFDQLMARPLIERWITLCCVSNDIGGDLVGNARWLGAPLAPLLREAGIRPEADQLLMRSYDGMTIGAPARVVMDGRDALLAIGMNGEALPIDHGFPVRVVVPGLYGYVSACKWIVDIEVSTYSQKAYWTLEGWTPSPPIQLMSRIDTPRIGGKVHVGRTVAVAGVAWDQHVGVDRVEVQIDDGAWQIARLAQVPSVDTWRQWVLEWTPPKAGKYRLRVRATDASGRVQTSAAAGVFPSGATGWHTITVHAV